MVPPLSQLQQTFTDDPTEYTNQTSTTVTEQEMCQKKHTAGGELFTKQWKGQEAMLT